jgi:hypothetical protein
MNQIEHPHQEGQQNSRQEGQQNSNQELRQNSQQERLQLAVRERRENERNEHASKTLFSGLIFVVV